MAKKDNGYMGNPNLRHARSTRTFSPDELKELMLCAEDIIYFAENYCTIITLDGKEHIKLYPYQKDLLDIMQNGKPEEDKYNSIVLSPRQSGKCVTEEAIVTIRNDVTGDIEDIEIGTLHESLKREDI
jgi:hypothetical protein